MPSFIYRRIQAHEGSFLLWGAILQTACQISLTHMTSAHFPDPVWVPLVWTAFGIGLVSMAMWVAVAVSRGTVDGKSRATRRRWLKLDDATRRNMDIGAQTVAYMGLAFEIAFFISALVRSATSTLPPSEEGTFADTSAVIPASVALAFSVLALLQYSQDTLFLSLPPPRYSETPPVKPCKTSCQPTMSREHHAFLVVMLLTYVIMAVGGACFSAIEQWEFVKGFYFCAMSFTTIGYGNVVPKNPGGKAFFIVFGVVGLITLARFLVAVKDVVVASSRATVERRMAQARAGGGGSLRRLLGRSLHGLENVGKRRTTRKQVSADQGTGKMLEGRRARKYGRRTAWAVGWLWRFFSFQDDVDLHGVAERTTSSTALASSATLDTAPTAIPDPVKLKAALDRRVFARVAVFVVVYWLVGGAIFYVFGKPDEWTFLDGIYFTFVTSATIGFGDYLPPTSAAWTFWLYYVFIQLGLFGVLIGSAVDATAVKEEAEAGAGSEETEEQTHGAEAGLSVDAQSPDGVV